MNLKQKIALSIGGTALAVALAFVPAWIATGAVETRMQKRQDAIVKNLCYNSLTRVSNEKEFMELYHTEEAAYDKTGSIMVTMDDLKQFEEIRKYWPYKSR